jgi:dimeric dUTPase (all-alpha-NTP-PPase superfamily)
MSHLFEEIRDFSDLANRLRCWSSFVDDTSYDFVGIVHLFSACLDNLKTSALESELEDIGDCLDDDQKKILLKISDFVRRKTEDESLDAN